MCQVARVLAENITIIFYLFFCVWQPIIQDGGQAYKVGCTNAECASLVLSLLLTGRLFFLFINDSTIGS